LIVERPALLILKGGGDRRGFGRKGSGNQKNSRKKGKKGIGQGRGGGPEETKYLVVPKAFLN